VQPGAIVDNKRLSAVLEHIKAQQGRLPGASAARARGAAATAEQPRGTGSAVEGPGPHATVLPRLPPEAGGLIAHRCLPCIPLRYSDATRQAGHHRAGPGYG